MDIKGFLDVSFVDWDGKVCSVIFLSNCNFRCPFCHNVNLVLYPETLETIPFEIIENNLKRQKGWIDGVCISGGEPTLHSTLPELCSELKKMGFLVKLDTNGTTPNMLKDLLDSKLVDYIAMDIKAPLTLEKYSKVTDVNIEKLLENVKKSIQILIESNVDYEFRTTVVPTLHTIEDVKQICQNLHGCKKYVLQKFDVGIGQEIIDPKLKSQTFSEKEMQAFLNVAQKLIPNTKQRGNLRQIEN